MKSPYIVGVYATFLRLSLDELKIELSLAPSLE